MSLNMKTLTQAFAKASAVIEKTVQNTVQEVTGLPKPMQDYDILDQVGSAGPGLAWKLYSAKSRDGHIPAVYSTVCVWVLDKKALSEARQRAGLSKAAEDAFLDLIRADAARLVRLRHPGVVHVVQALDESKSAMAMVTEPVFASIANALGNLENLSKVPKELKGMVMGLLEVKHGLLQVAETLDFIHNNARLVHRAISPETVLITSNGAWKLGGFSFAISTDQSPDDSFNEHAFHYAEYDVEDSILPLQPSINYAAPELVRRKASSVGSACDIFSLGCLAYHLIARKPLLNCNNNVKMYTNSLTYLTTENFSAIPRELVPDLQRMLSVNDALRQTALDFTGSSFFRDDTRLRALRFLDHMLARDNMQKSEFLKALSDMWKDFDPRVLRYKVLPPLCAELRNLVMQPMILPMVLTIAESQDKNDFEQSTMPALAPVLNSAAGETLLLLLKHAELIINKANHEHIISHILPMLIRAYDDPDPRLQEEVLKKTIPLSRKLDVQLVKQSVLPRIHGLALKTTVAAVRVNALLCLADMVNLLEKSAVLDILQTIHRCTSVDHSAPTLMCTLGVANSILKQYGIEFVAEHVLPLLVPLLITQQLNVQQFAKYMLFVKDVLRKIEEKRGVTLSETRTSEIKTLPPVAEVAAPQTNRTTSSPTASTRRSSSTWDEDWLPPPTKAAAASAAVSSSSSSNPILSQPISATVSSCPAVDVEWPPKYSSGPVTQFSDAEDPFSDWPPRQNNAAPPLGGGVSSSLNNGKIGGASTTSSSSSSNGIVMPTENYSLGYMKRQNNSGGNISSADLGSIFGVNRRNNEKRHVPIRLAPPPTSAVSRGRGVSTKTPTEQSSLLDLL